MLETNRLKIYVVLKEQMEKFIEAQTIKDLKIAYKELIYKSIESQE